MIDEEHLVGGVVDHEGELFGEEAQVEGVEDRAHAGDRVVEFEVAIIVPGERTDTVARLDPEIGQHVRQPLDPRGAVAVGVAVAARPRVW